MHGLEDVCSVNVLALLKSLQNVLKTSLQDEYLPTGIWHERSIRLRISHQSYEYRCRVTSIGESYEYHQVELRVSRVMTRWALRVSFRTFSLAFYDNLGGLTVDFSYPGYRFTFQLKTQCLKSGIRGATSEQSTRKLSNRGMVPPFWYS